MPARPAGHPNSLIGGGVSAPVTASANSGPALIGVTFAFNAVGGGAVTQNGADGAGQAGGAPNSLIGGGVSAPVTASANSGPALIGVTFAFNTAGGGAVTQNGADGAGQAGGAPNSLIGGGVSAPVTASANSGPALIGVTFAFNTVGGGAVTRRADGAGQDGGAPNSLIGGGVSAPGYGVCEQRPGPDRSDLCV